MTRPRFCELIDHQHAKYDPRYVDRVIANSRRQADGPADQDPRSHASPAGSAPAAEWPNHLRLIHTCPYRSVAPGCGCNGAVCGLRASAADRAAGVVAVAECLECVAQYG